MYEEQPAATIHNEDGSGRGYRLAREGKGDVGHSLHAET